MILSLKPCPFCGGKAVIRPTTSESAFYWGKCINDECWAEGGIASTPQEAAKKWNRRIEDVD